MEKLPIEVIDIIFKCVHDNNLKNVNTQFKKFVSCAISYHILQEYRNIGNKKTVLDFTECCFRYPKSIKHLKI